MSANQAHRASRPTHRLAVAAVLVVTLVAGACSPSRTAAGTGSDRDPDRNMARGGDGAEFMAADLAALLDTGDERAAAALGALVRIEDRELETFDVPTRQGLLEELGADALADGRVQVASLHPDELADDDLEALAEVLGEEGLAALLEPSEVTLDEITLFDEGDAEQIFELHLGDAAAGAPSRRTLDDDGRAGGFLTIPESIATDGLTTLAPTTDVPPDEVSERSPTLAPERSPSPRSLHVGPIDDTGSGAGNQHESGDDIASGIAAVTRYVAHDELPLFVAADFDSDQVLTFSRGDRVFVLSDLPRPVGDTVFVRVQAPDTPPYSAGWMPLYWLYASPVDGVHDTLAFTTTYGLLATALTSAIEQTFYGGCDHYPQTAQSPLFPNNSPIPVLDPAAVPPDKQYACGEYPIGVTGTDTISGLGTLDGKWLPPISLPVPAVNATLKVLGNDAAHFAIHEWGEPRQVRAEPLVARPRVNRLDGQVAPEPYMIRDLATSHSGAPIERENTFYVAKATPATADHNAVIYDVPRVDAEARVHGNDAWFNVSFEPPTGVTAVADAYINVCSRLPGGSVDTPRTPANIGLYSEVAKVRRSHITGIELGGIEFSPMTVCATAVVTEPGGTFNEGSAGGMANDLVAGTPPALHVRFIKGTISDLTIRHTGKVELHGDFDKLHNVLLAIVLNQVNGFLKQGADGAGLWRLLAGLPLKKGVSGPNDVATLLDGRFTEATTSLEQLLVGQLNTIVEQLRSAMLNPATTVRDACNSLMPVSYRQVSSRYYVMYLQCLEATREAEISLIANSGTTAHCYEPQSFARVSEGAGWRHSGDQKRLLYIDQEEDAIGYSHVLHRPPWARWGGCGIRSELSTTVMSEYWPLLRCMERIVDEGVNHGWSAHKLRTTLRSDCELPAVKMLCDVYGESADLRGMWELRHGSVPNVGPYVGLCSYYRDLIREPGTDIAS